MKHYQINLNSQSWEYVTSISILDFFNCFDEKILIDESLSIIEEGEGYE